MSKFKLGDEVVRIKNLNHSLKLPMGHKSEVTNIISKAIMYVDGLPTFISHWELQEPEVIKHKTTTDNSNPKYDKTIVGKYGSGECTIDVYRVLDAFGVTNPQLQHLIKKALNAGTRGHKDEMQDLVDILHSAQSALDMYNDKEV